MAAAKIISHESCEVLKNTYLRAAASESVRYILGVYSPFKILFKSGEKV